MDTFDYECQLAMLKGLKSQADETAAALERVLALLKEIRKCNAKKTIPRTA